MRRKDAATDWVSQLLDRPFEGVTGFSAGDRRRVRMIALNAYVSVGFAVLLMLAHLTLGPRHLGVFNGLAGSAFILNLAWLRRHRSAEFAGIVAAALTLASMAVEVHVNGGFWGPAMDFWQVTPILAIVVWGYRTAMYTTVATLMMVVWFWWVVPVGLVFDPAVEMGREALVYRWVTLLGVVSLLETIDFERRMVRALMDQTTGHLVEPSARGEPGLDRAHHMAILGRLAAGVGHEINTPLATSMGQVELAMEAVRSGRNPLPHILEADGALGVVASLVEDLRTYTLDSGREDPGPVRLSDALADSLKLVENDLRHRATLRVEVESKLDVAGDTLMWTRVFVQLLNSVGDTIEPGNATAHELLVRLRSVDDGCEVVIEESTLGHTEDDAVRLSEVPRDRERSTRLSGFLSQTLIRSAGGTLRVEDRVGATGARVRVWIPALQRG